MTIRVVRPARHLAEEGRSQFIGRSRQVAIEDAPVGRRGFVEKHLQTWITVKLVEKISQGEVSRGASEGALGNFL